MMHNGIVFMVKISAQSQSPLQSLSVHFDIWSLLGLTTFVPSLTAVSVAPMHGTVASLRRPRGGWTRLTFVK